MDDLPKVRLIDAFPVEQDGKTVIHLKDPLNLAAPLGVSPVGYFILAHFDGHRSLTDVQEAYAKQFNAVLPSDQLKSLIAMLDEHYYLHSERFRRHQDAIIQQFRSAPIRPPGAHRWRAGRSGWN
jgi:hypothetical protein